MTEGRKQFWKEYGVSLLIAYGIASIFAFLVPEFVRASSLQLWQRTEIWLMSGAFFGNAFFFLGYAKERIRMKSFLLTSVLRSLVTCTILVAGFFVIVPTSLSMFNPNLPLWSPRLWSGFLQVFPVSLIATLTALGLGFSILLNAFAQINKKLGPGILVNWITGKYYEPQEEERIFMFLDLKHSTTLAEKLGNRKFSKLCQDFFRDLSMPVIESKGEVSHYIGDEAVLTWKPNNGLEQGNCLRCFELMQKQITLQAPHYQKEYGITPEFKAGVHIGLVIAAEVGDIKSEIVYHGDVLNTTARITGLCSELGSDLLVSGELMARIALPPGLTATSIGPRLLKGKEHAVEIVKVGAKSAELDLQPLPATERQPRRAGNK